MVYDVITRLLAEKFRRTILSHIYLQKIKSAKYLFTVPEAGVSESNTVWFVRLRFVSLLQLQHLFQE
ncbi:hypothetical protein HMPREF9447_01950 [Bacteroides oleiciplenus YIT 12058]|uniref:Uncharacterized protein n=1 Tax=Bacteroides oleiciplenus YIT 12058 TaxID=742727 RepID=K9EHT8_9BACE|nr:hypothetical protein HMPREF9447_01950 [Bacteroides oleiciplenus YIT 12058]